MDGIELLREHPRLASRNPVDRHLRARQHRDRRARHPSSARSTSSRSRSRSTRLLQRRSSARSARPRAPSTAGRRARSRAASAAARADDSPSAAPRAPAHDRAQRRRQRPGAALRRPHRPHPPAAAARERHRLRQHLGRRRRSRRSRRLRRLDRLRDDALPRRHRREDRRASAGDAARLRHHEPAREDAGRDSDPRRLRRRVLRRSSRAGGVEHPGGGDRRNSSIDRRYEIGDPDDGGKYIAHRARPTGSTCDYMLDYPAPVGRQEYVFQLHRHRRRSAPRSRRRAPSASCARSQTLEQMGLASGGRLQQLHPDRRGRRREHAAFPDEFARHKILDIIGDFYLLGRPLRGRVVARMTGHSDNVALLKQIDQQLAD